MGIKARSSVYFSSSVVMAAVSLLTLPLTTRILGPRDYGIFALGAAVAGMGAVLATVGFGYAVARRWGEVDRPGRTRLVSTVTASAVAVAGGWALLGTAAFLALRGEVELVAEVPVAGFLLAMVGTAIAPVWGVAAEILTVEGRAGLFSAATIAQSLVTAAVTLVTLFVFDLGTVSLFAGLFAGGLVGLAAGLPVVAPYLRPRFDRGVARELAQGAFALSQATESLQPLVERVLLSRFAGFADLGLYTHSQRYRQLALHGTKAVARGVWPVTLEEARQPAGSFPATRRTWDAVHVAVACVGLALTAVGDRLIALLTNGKFTEAWIFVPAWFVITLVQLSAKPEVGAVYAFGRGATVARLGIVSNVVALAATVALVPVVGVWGAVAAVFVQAVAYRVLVRVPARRLRPVPFQDHWVLAGMAAIGAAWGVKLVIGDDVGRSLVLLAVSEALFLALAAPVVGRTARALPHWRPRRV